MGSSTSGIFQLINAWRRPLRYLAKTCHSYSVNGKDTLYIATRSTIGVLLFYFLNYYVEAFCIYMTTFLTLKPKNTPSLILPTIILIFVTKPTRTRTPRYTALFSLFFIYLILAVPH